MEIAKLEKKKIIIQALPYVGTLYDKVGIALGNFKSLFPNLE